MKTLDKKITGMPMNDSPLVSEDDLSSVSVMIAEQKEQKSEKLNQKVGVQMDLRTFTTTSLKSLV